MVPPILLPAVQPAHLLPNLSPFASSDHGGPAIPGLPRFLRTRRVGTTKSLCPTVCVARHVKHPKNYVAQYVGLAGGRAMPDKLGQACAAVIQVDHGRFGLGDSVLAAPPVY